MNKLYFKNQILWLIMAVLGITACNGPSPHIEPMPKKAPAIAVQSQLYLAIEAEDLPKIIEIGQNYPVEFEAPFAYKNFSKMTPLQYAIAIKKYNIAEKMLTNFDIRKLNPWHRVNGDNVIETILRMPKRENLYDWVRHFVTTGDIEQVKYLLSDLETLRVFKRHSEIWAEVKNRGLHANDEKPSEEKTKKADEEKKKSYEEKTKKSSEEAKKPEEPKKHEEPKKAPDDKTKESDTKMKPIGIKNAGNHCYADSAMQVLMLMPHAYFKEMEELAKKTKFKEEEQFLKNVLDFRNTWISGNASPESLKDKLDIIIEYGVANDIYKFIDATNKKTTIEQEDAHEFLIGITGLMRDSSFPHFKETSLIEWKNSKGESETSNTNVTVGGLILNSFDAKQQPFPNNTELQKVFDAYFAKVPVKDYENPPKINDAFRTLGLKLKGDYVFVTLSRFTSNKEKIITKIDFADGTVDLGPYTEAKKEEKFSLIGTTIHIGGNISGGHYTARVKYGDKWYDANDSSISETTFKEVKADAAQGGTIMLFKRNNK